MVPPQMIPPKPGEAMTAKEITLKVKAYENGYSRGFADALEKAAKVAEERCQCPHHISIAYEIRSLRAGERAPAAEKPDLVEEKIDELSEHWRDDGTCSPKDYYVQELRALVSLVREEGREQCKCDDLFAHHSKERCWND